MFRKVLVSVCCIALELTGPSVTPLYSLGAQNPSPYIWDGNHWVSPDLQQHKGTPLTVEALREEISNMNLSPQFAERWKMIDQRLSLYAAPSMKLPGAVTKAVQDIRDMRSHGAESAPSADGSNYLLARVLARTFDFAVNLEKNYEIPKKIEDNKDRTVEITTNSRTGQFIEKKYVYHLKSSAHKVVIWERDPDHPGALRKKAIDFVYLENGNPKELLVYDRSLVDLIKVAADHQEGKRGWKDEIKDTAHTPEDRRKALEAATETAKSTYESPELKDILAKAEMLANDYSSGDLSEDKAKAGNKRLEELRTRYLEFQAKAEFGEVRKGAMGTLVDSWKKIMGRTSNPVDAAELSKITIEKLSERLNDLTKGQDYENINMTLAPEMVIGGAIYGPPKMDPEADMPKTERARIRLLARDIGLAEDAERNMEYAVAQGNVEEEKAARSSLILFTQRAERDMQAMGNGALKDTLQRMSECKEGDCLSPSQHREAERQGENVRRIDGQFETLDREALSNQMKAAAASLLLNWRVASGGLSRAETKDRLSVMTAKVREMRELYLSRPYAEFLSNDANFTVFRLYQTKHGNPSDYYLDLFRRDPSGKVPGLYDYFIAHSDPKIKAAVQGFNDMIAALSSSGGDAEIVRNRLNGLQGQLGAMLRTAGLPETPSIEDVKREETQLIILQHKVNEAAAEAKNQLDAFLLANTLYLARERHLSSDNIEETRSKNWILRQLEWLDTLPNIGGGASNRGEGVIDKVAYKALESIPWTSEDFKLLLSGDARDRLDRVLQMMSNGRYYAPKPNECSGEHCGRGAFEEVLGLDPDAALKGRFRYWIDADKTAGREYDALGGKSPTTDDMLRIIEGARQRHQLDAQESMGTLFRTSLSGEQAAAVQSVLRSSFNRIEDLRWWYQGVSTPLKFGMASLVTGPAARVASLALKGAGWLLLSGAEATENIAILGRGLNLLGVLPARWGEGLETIYHLPKMEELFSSPAKSLWRIEKNSFAANYQLAKGFSIFGGVAQLLETGVIEHNTTFRSGYLSPSGYKEIGKKVLIGALSNASFAATTGWISAFAIPTAAVQGENVISRAYRAFGDSEGPMSAMVHAGIRLRDALPNALAMRSELWSTSVAKGIVEHERGLWGYLGERYLSVPARVSISAGRHLDLQLKFFGYTDWIVRPAVQNFYYWEQSFSNKVPQRDIDPSVRAQNWVASRGVGDAAASLSFLLIPARGYASPQAMREWRDTEAAVRSLGLSDRATRNLYFETPSDSQTKFEVNLRPSVAPILWMKRGVSSMFRSAFGLKPLEPLRVSPDESTKERVAVMDPRNRDRSDGKLTMLDRLAYRLVAEMEEDENSTGGVRVLYQKLLQREDRVKVVRGEPISPDKPDRDGPTGAMWEEGDPVLPEFVTANNKQLERELVRDPESLRRIRNATLADPLIIEGVPVRSPDAIRAIQRVAANVLEGSIDREVQKAIKKGLRKKLNDLVERKLSTIDLSASDSYERFVEAVRLGLEPEFDGTRTDTEWARVVRKMTRGVRSWSSATRLRAENMEWALQQTHQEVVKDVFYELIAEIADRHISRISEDQIHDQAVKYTACIDAVLRLSPVKDGQIDRLRSMEDDPSIQPEFRQPEQREALINFFEVLLRGKDDAGARAKVMRIFMKLRASGGKTLLIKVLFLPLAKVQATGGNTANVLKKLWNWIRRSKREAEVLTSSGPLVLQGDADYASYSGGRLLSASGAHIRTFGDHHSEELSRYLRKERPKARESVFIIDEGDYPAELTPVMQGSDNGRLTDPNNPITRDVLIRSLNWAERSRTEVEREERDRYNGHISPYELSELVRGRRDEIMADPQTRAEIEGEAQAWRDLMAGPRWAPGLRWLFRLWPSSAFRESMMKKGVTDRRAIRRAWAEAKNAERVVHGMFGRFHVDRELLDQAENFPQRVAIWMQAIGSKVREEGLGWFTDDGKETYLKFAMARHLNLLTAGDISEFVLLDPKTGEVKPLHGGAENSKLDTEHRLTMQLLSIRENGTGHVDMPLSNLGTLTVADVLALMRKGGAPVYFLSGTCAKIVKNWMRGVMGVVFANEKGETRSEPGNIHMLMPRVAETGEDRVAIVDSENRVEELSLPIGPMGRAIQAMAEADRFREAGDTANANLIYGEAIEHLLDIAGGGESKAAQETIQLLQSGRYDEARQKAEFADRRWVLAGHLAEEVLGWEENGDVRDASLAENALGLVEKGTYDEAIHQLAEISGAEGFRIAQEIIQLLNEGKIEEAKKRFSDEGPNNLKHGYPLVLEAVSTNNEIDALTGDLVARGVPREQIVILKAGATERDSQGLRKEEEAQDQKPFALKNGTARVVLMTDVTYARGINPTLSKYSYIRFARYNQHTLATIRARQLQARVGTGRRRKVAVLDPIEMVVQERLRADPFYLQIVRKQLETAFDYDANTRSFRSDRGLDDIAAKLAENAMETDDDGNALRAPKPVEVDTMENALVPVYDALRDDIQHGGNAAVKEFATDPRVYRLMMPAAQEDSQARAISGSGILAPKWASSIRRAERRSVPAQPGGSETRVQPPPLRVGGNQP